MRFETKEVILKNGETAVFRSPKPEDAEQMLAYLKTCCAETEFVIRYPEECTETIDQEASFLQRILDSKLDMMVVCQIGGEIAGNCQLSLHGRLKTRHRAGVAIALVKAHWGKGIGTAMLSELVEAARQHGITQLELEVIEGNERAMGLYRKLGFAVAAEKPNAIRLKDGTMLREYIMIKPL